MKIAFVSLLRVFAWGGSEELWFRTAQLALTQGHTVYSLTHKGNNISNKIIELQQLGAITKFYFKPQYSLVDRVAIKAKIKQSQINVVPNVEADVYIISSGTVFDCLYYRELVEEIIQKNKPYIIINQHNFENGRIPSLEQREYIINLFSKAKRNFFVSQRNLITAERQIAYHISDAAIIGNPLNIASPAMKSFPISSSLLMACVARLDCDFKGQDILLQTLSQPQWVGREFSLKFYGTGPHHDYLQTLIELYGLQNKVTLEGHVSNIDHIWETNQIMILPSLSEGTSLSMVEAMVSGRAVFTTDVGDSERYIISGKTGFLAAFASVKCLSAGLEEVWQSRDSLEEMGRNAFDHAIAITDLHPDKSLLDYIETLQ